ncbi:MAG: ATP synthase F1 subunit epsilon [Geminicoccaceae bacterium]
MADKVTFQLVSPERELASVQADMVVAPGAEGDFGVLPLHAPFISTLRPGVIAVYDGDTVTKRYFVAGGFAEVNEQGIIVLAEDAQEVTEIDRAAAEHDLERAKRHLDRGEGDVEKLEKTVRIEEARVAAASAAT